MSYNAAERRDVRKAEKVAKIAERQRLAEIRTQMSTPVARAYMYEKLERSHLFTTTFNTNSMTMAFLEGQRFVGLQLLGDIMVACPNRYVEMLNERNARDLERESAENRDDDNDDRDEGPVHTVHPGDD